MPVAYLLYFALLLTVVGLSMVRWKLLDRADRALSILLVTTLFSEVLAFVLVKTRGTNILLHHFYSPIEFFLISLYFNYSLKIFRGRI